MKRDQSREPASDQPASQVESAAVNDRLNDTDMQDYESSADEYERRWRQKIRLDRCDWWMAAAVYLFFASVAFVVL